MADGGFVMQSGTISGAALALLRRRVAGEDIPVTDQTRPLYRELAGEGLMRAGHDFLGGREAFYAFTPAGVKLAEVLGRVNGPWPAESAGPRP